ncbi:ORF6C domain-containing protein [Lysinibacillus sp. NPDC047702]|uniref:ORF6C domain-containing protein n=1 Tax=unclassified Lysinibacillus TaxID=2636778 RepID=UPI003D02D58E
MNQLTVVEQKFVPFGEHELLAVKITDGKIYAAVKWVCAGIGLTRDQIKNERNKIQNDLVLSKGGRNLTLPTNGGIQDILCIELDFLPLWLAKISITPSMQETNPLAVKNLVNYQLKAKDVLAEAFLPKQLSQDPITLALESALETRKQVQGIQNEVIEMKADVEELKDNLYIVSVQAKAIKNKVGEKVYEALGGKDSNAFKHLKSKLFAACWRDLKNYFDISEYRELPRVKFELGMKFLFAWQPNTELRLEIEHYNTQSQLKLVK